MSTAERLDGSAEWANHPHTVTDQDDNFTWITFEDGSEAVIVDGLVEPLFAVGECCH